VRGCDGGPRGDEVGEAVAEAVDDKRQGQDVGT
jgi:hypothetical protein